MVGKPQQPSEPWSPQKRRNGAIIAVVVVAAIAGASVYTATRPDSYAGSRNGCVNVHVSGVTGGQILHQCGAQARSWCATEYTLHNQLALLVQPQCRLAGILPAAGTTPAGSSPPSSAPPSSSPPSSPPPASAPTAEPASK